MVGISRSPKPTNCCFHRYLKPGALARLRDSKIGAARSLRPKSSPPPILDSDLQIPLQSPATDAIPCLFANLYGPQSLNRKKLSAPRSVLFARLPSSDLVLESTNEADDTSRSNSSGSLMGGLNSDVVVVAH
ncbi:hypothetical protein LINPERPRIM_LOCUS5518 [Linum perenne]